jgi:HK97 family phage major capsid protein
VSLDQTYIDQSQEVAAKRAALHGLYEQADTITDAAKRDELAGSIKSSNLELNDLVDKLAETEKLVADRDRNRDAMKASRQPVGRQIIPTNEPEEDDLDVESIGAKSVRELLRGSMKASGLKSMTQGGDGFRGFRGPVGELALKTLISSSALAPLSDRQPVVPSAQEEATVADLMLQGTTSGQVIDYYEETTFTNAAATVDEGAAKPEGALNFTLRTSTVRKIATFVPVTDEMLADVPAFESYLRERLGFMVRRTEETQLLTGDGTGTNILGLLNRSGVQTSSGLGHSTIDSIYLGITKVRAVGFAEPTGFIAHPNDWADVRLSKDTTGQYLLGPANEEGPVRIFGLQGRLTTAMTENTLLVGAFRPHAQVFRRSGIEIAISTENEDYFIKNKVAVRAEERLALAVYRPAAFCKVDAIVIGS